MASHEVPEKKQTTRSVRDLGEAYEMWKADPAGRHIVDVRTPEEYIFVGHAPMARNIPLGFITYTWDAEQGRARVQLNPEFLAAVQSTTRRRDTLLVTCRSGGRSALAVNALAKAGFTNVYNIIDGFEGDKVAEPAASTWASG